MYIVEGNIGAGKSTFLQLLATHARNISVALEPLHEWQHQLYGQSLLANFYQNPKRWAYTFENLTLISRIQNHLAEQHHQGVLRVMERSIYSGNYVFARNSYEQEFLTTLEWQIYQEWFTLLTAKCHVPQGFIYLRIDPEIAYERTKKRNRQAESALTLSYLRQIHEKHEAFLIERHAVTEKLHDVPLLILEAYDDFEQNNTLFMQHLKKIEQFFQVTKQPNSGSCSTFISR